MTSESEYVLQSLRLRAGIILAKDPHAAILPALEYAIEHGSDALRRATLTEAESLYGDEATRIANARRYLQSENADCVMRQCIELRAFRTASSQSDGRGQPDLQATVSMVWRAEPHSEDVRVILPQGPGATGGLKDVPWLVELHRGSIESSPSAGSAFGARLRAAREALLTGEITRVPL